MSQNQPTMEDCIKTYEYIKTFAWSGSLVQRQRVFKMKENMDELLGLEAETVPEIENDTITEPEDKSEFTVGMEDKKDWPYGPVIDKARDDMFANFVRRKLGLDDESEVDVN